jgi:hypothetical protein
MREYLMNVIGAALIAGVISVIVPTGSGEGLKKYVTLIGSLCVLCVLISPVTELLGAMTDLSDGGFSEWYEGTEEEYGGKYNEFLMSVGKDNVEDGITALLYEQYGIPEDECSVSAVVEEKDGELVIVRVDIILTGKSVLKDPYAIEKYISGLLDCECKVK